MPVLMGSERTRSVAKPTAKRGHFRRVAFLAFPAVMRSITWIPLAAATLIATVLVAWRHGHTGDASLYLVAVLLPSAAAFALDDPATELLAASPTSLLRRRLLRVLVVGPPVAVIWTVLLWWGFTHGLEETAGLMLIFTGLLGLSLGAAALAGRRSGGRAGGIFTPPAILVLLFLSSVFPPRWRPLPMGDIPGGWPQIYLRWGAAAVLGMVAFLVSSRDPAARLPGTSRFATFSSSGRQWGRGLRETDRTSGDFTQVPRSGG
jgi:hypothetical protein